MNTFFDLREFLLTILKKLKFCIVLTVILTLAGGIVRFVPLMLEYLNFEEPTLQSSEESLKEFPYKYQARRTIYIEPDYEILEGIAIDRSNTVAASYLACYQNKEILEPLIDKYYSDAAKDFMEYNQKLVNYNYNTKSILEKIYTLPDFYSSFSIRSSGGTDSKIGSYINIYATTGNEELSENMVTDLEKLLSNYVQTLVGHQYTYTITEGQIGMLMPQAVDGLIPKSISSGSENKAVRLEMGYIIKRSIKGCIWGMAGGIGLSILLCFLFNCLSLNLVSEDDLKNYEVPLITSVKLPKRKNFLGFINTWIDLLEGNHQNCGSYAEAAKMASSYLQVLTTEEEGTIVVTGTGTEDALTEFSQSLKAVEDRFEILESPSICVSSETVNKVSNATGILLFEELGSSNRQEIQKEIDRIHQLGKPIYGIVLKK